VGVQVELWDPLRTRVIPERVATWLLGPFRTHIDSWRTYSDRSLISLTWGPAKLAINVEQIDMTWFMYENLSSSAVKCSREHATDDCWHRPVFTCLVIHWLLGSCRELRAWKPVMLILASAGWREVWRPSPKVDLAFSGQKQGWKIND